MPIDTRAWDGFGGPGIKVRLFFTCTCETCGDVLTIQVHNENTSLEQVKILAFIAGHQDLHQKKEK